MELGALASAGRGAGVERHIAAHRTAVNAENGTRTAPMIGKEMRALISLGFFSPKLIKTGRFDQ
jgi:hypothetical protein